MDSITQAALGAAIGEAMLGQKAGYKGALAGALIATIPDLDVLFYLFYDSFEMLSIHRGFSHSILFSFIASPLISVILKKFNWGKNVNYRLLVIFSWLCLFTHILLDTFTAYGTQLLSPFSDVRFGFDSINVVDPVYTIPLLIGLILSLWMYRNKPQRSKFSTWGIIISSFYLLFTLAHKEMVKSSIVTQLSADNIEYTAMLTMPVGVANINWYAVAKGKDSLYLKKQSIVSDYNHGFVSFPINDSYLTEVDPIMAHKMRWFAKGFYTVEKVNETIRIYNLQVDMRGITKEGDKRAPTKGYFEISNNNGQSEFSSGSIQSLN